MGRVKLKHYVVRKARHGYWVPTPKMRAMGFQLVPCGHDGPKAWAIAVEWEERWQRTRRGEEPLIRAIYPPDSVGDAFERYRRSDAWAEKKARTREDWERGWKHIEPIFGDVAPATITFEMLDKWYSGLKRRHGVDIAYRAMKTWRALYRVMSSMKLCAPGADPSAAIRRETPQGRTATWSEGEAVRLAKGAWRAGYRGLACVIAVAWDTGFSPVDARTLTAAQIVPVGNAWGFFVERGKTGEPALGTLSSRTRRLVQTYIAELGFELHDDAPIFRTRGFAPGPKGGRPRQGSPYTKDSLVGDFADVRSIVFGPEERRKLMDMRRSGAVEAMAGDATAEAMSAKLANSMDRSKALWRTYLPVDPATVQGVDRARVLGRHRLRQEQSSDKKLKLGGEKS
jgi:hypothetical protein